MEKGFQKVIGARSEQYESLLLQLKAITVGETDLIANMANITACIKEQFGWHWVGFYLVKGQELVLGPFQGPLACTRIAFGKGVCGTAWKNASTLIVEDVTSFEGHIACSAHSRSEIVVPVYINNSIVAVLDIDSEQLADFGQTDALHLEAIGRLLDK